MGDFSGFDFDQIFRKGGRACHHCDARSEQCQLADWKAHKQECKRYAEQKNDAAAQVGESFVDYNAKWRMQWRISISMLAAVLVPDAQILSSILVVCCNYTTVGREKHQRIQVQSAKCASVSETSRVYSCDMTSELAELRANTARYTDKEPVVYRYILITVVNNDLPKKMEMVKFVHGGFPTSVNTDALNFTPDSVIATINSGTLGHP
ncbi:hypothetical protein B484DRAFT_404317 [Ochromonadaceae sp. CCMP2298]|nr:hypothetical protein B484DRAFT_404317 [Ochromonadaceae sp. CCMP2298]